MSFFKDYMVLLPFTPK